MRRPEWRMILTLAAIGFGLALAAPAAPRRAGILLVYAPSDGAQEEVAVAVKKRLQILRVQAGYSKEQIPFVSYYFDKPDERHKCQTLQIGAGDLPFLGVVSLNRDGDPAEVLNRFPKVHQAGIADAAFGKAQALLGLTPRPGPPPSAVTTPPTAVITPPAAASTAQVTAGTPPAAVTTQPTTVTMPPPTAGAGEITNPKDGSVLVRIPGGAFTMAQGAEAQQVTLPDYYIGKVEVTNAQYRRFINESGYKEAGDWEPYARWGDSAPVVNVTWQDAVAYCQWAGLRLPTEAEWEKAARGTDGRTYPWGNEWDPSRCRNSVGGATGSAINAVAVGSYPAGASPYGCLDMAGNVWQWCATKFRHYPYSRDGREDPGSGDEPRVLRGGSWFVNLTVYFRTYNRYFSSPIVHNGNRGSRVARNP